MAAKQLSLTLSTGAKMPAMGFGTLMENLEPDFERVVDVVENAIDVGYRHLDTAQVYNTEPMVGQAVRNKVKAGAVTREDIFLVTKLWRSAFRQQDVVPSLKESLERLGLPYVDLFLIHWPTAFKSGPEVFPKDESGKMVYANIDYLETWKGLEECVDLGLTKAIGLSNFNSKQIQRILDNCRIKPVNLQIESHPFLSNTKLIDFCRKKGISVTAYAPLAGFNPTYRADQGWPTVFTDKRITALAEKYSKTPAQIALRYQLDRGLSVVPKSAKRDRMEENFGALSFRLSEEDIQQLDGCNINMRLCDEFADHPFYPFHEEF